MNTCNPQMKKRHVCIFLESQGTCIDSILISPNVQIVTLNV